MPLRWHIILNIENVELWSGGRRMLPSLFGLVGENGLESLRGRRDQKDVHMVCQRWELPMGIVGR